MWFHNDTVSVAYGYCADSVILEDDLEQTHVTNVTQLAGEELEGILNEDELNPWFTQDSQSEAESKRQRALEGLIIDTPGYDGMWMYEKHLARTLRPPPVVLPQVVDIVTGDPLADERSVQLHELKPHWFAPDSQSLRAELALEKESLHTEETAIPHGYVNTTEQPKVVEKQEPAPYTLKELQQREQLALWTFVISNEARRITKKQPISVLRTALKKLRKITPTSKPFTRNVIKRVVKQSDSWLASWVDNIVAESMKTLAPTTLIDEQPSRTVNNEQEDVNAGQ
jgi:hypothetical protein